MFAALNDQAVRNADKASSSKNKTSPIAINACVSVHSSAANKLGVGTVNARVAPRSILSELYVGTIRLHHE